MTNKTKTFNVKLYAVVVFVLVAAILATVTVTVYKSKYTAFSPEKVAVAFTENNVNRGDGYNSYKNTLVSKNFKYGDYIRQYYMYPLIYAECGYKPGDPTGDLKGFNDKTYMSDKTANDTGVLAGQLTEEMYPYYEQLVSELNGWGDYDTFFTKYFAKLVQVREEIFGDKYLTDEIMFTALEANVTTYGDKLTGTEDVTDQNTGVKTSAKSIGLYEEKYGEDYVFSYEVTNTADVEDLSAYRGTLNTKTLETYKVSVDDISDVKTVTVRIKVNGDTVIESYDVTVVKIKSSWYVDNLTTDTAALYDFYK